MRRREWALLILVAGAATVLGQNHEAMVDRVTRALMCTCGCPHIIHQCGDECGVAPQLTEGIAQLIRSGSSEQEVIDMFVARHGKVVLAVPRAEGFNLLAWVLPFVGLGVGAVVVFVVVRNLKPRTDQTVAAGSGEIAAEYRQIIDEELRR